MKVRDVGPRLGEPPIFPRQDLNLPAASDVRGFDGDSGYKALMSGVMEVGLTFSRSLFVHLKAEKTEQTFSSFTLRAMLCLSRRIRL